MDLMTASSLMSPHHAMFKASAMNPYLNYARMKGLTEQSMMAATPNVCRDPYCTGCPASPHYINKASGQPCPAGCPQCEGGGGGSNGGGSSSILIPCPVGRLFYFFALKQSKQPLPRV